MDSSSQRSNGMATWATFLTLEETQAQRDEVTCPRLQTNKRQKQDLNTIRQTLAFMCQCKGTADF